jgi:hypothetical protein
MSRRRPCARRSKPRWWNTTGREALTRWRHAGHTGERGTGSTRSARSTWRWEWKATRRRRERETVRRNTHAIGPWEWRHRRHTSTAARRWRKLSRRCAGHSGEWRRNTTWEAEGRRGKAVARLVLRKHGVRVGLTLGSIRRRD